MKQQDLILRIMSRSLNLKNILRNPQKIGRNIIDQSHGMNNERDLGLCSPENTSNSNNMKFNVLHQEITEIRSRRISRNKYSNQMNLDSKFYQQRLNKW